jgi:predicted XRE-type DNA-binding protein
MRRFPYDILYSLEGDSAFHDLENDPKVAENLRLRALLMMRLSAWMNEQQLSQREAAATLGVSQPRVSDLVRGQIDKFSLDALPPSRLPAFPP